MSLFEPLQVGQTFSLAGCRAARPGPDSAQCQWAGPTAGQFERKH